ncbi:MAG TPA: 6-phosphogluconolactonase [Acidimicrobiales bacterium]
MKLPPPVPDVPGAFVDTVLQAFAARPGQRFVLFLSGGPTAKLCYEALAAAAGPNSAQTIDWMLVDIYMGDERVVPPDDPDANQGLVRQALLDQIGSVGSFNPMPTTMPVDQCVTAYSATLRAVLDGPGIDLIHLGMGPDGHTASLFPGAPTLDAGPDELAAATEDPNGRNPHPRLTVTLPVINAARCAVFTVTGQSKVDAVEALQRGDDIPAARVASARVIWLMDDAAAARRP